VKRREPDADDGHHHLEYWNSGERALMKKLDRRLVELCGVRGDGTRFLGMDVK
jgi:hypothetical protein